nr:MAG TPA: Protein of unknown function (DUF1617) [Caudoviricetes sp.]
MEFKVKNKDLNILYTTLEKISIKKLSANRGKVRLLSKIFNKNTEYVGDLKEIFKTYLVLEEDGRPKLTEEGHLIFINEEEIDSFNRDVNELDNELVIVNLTEDETKINNFLNTLEDVDLDLNTQEIKLLDEVLEQIEK